MHFCESFDAPSPIVGIGHDEDWTVLQGQFSMTAGTVSPFVCNWPNRVMQGERNMDATIGGTDGADQFFRVKIDSLGTSSYVQLWLRCDDMLAPNRHAYTFAHSRYPGLSADNAFVQIGKYVADTFTQLAVATVPFVAGEVLEATVEGTTLRLFINDVQVLTATDSSIDGVAAHPGIGLEWWLDCTTGFGTTSIDYAYGGDLAEDTACEDAPTVVPPTRITCGRTFTPTPCPPECPVDVDAPSLVTSVPAPSLSGTVAFASPLFLLGLVTPLAITLGLPTTCGRTFTATLPEMEACN